MTHYTRNGTVFRVTKQGDLDITNKLPPGTFIIKADQFGNLFLDKIEDFDLPRKLYGDCIKNADRILNTFNDRPNATGVLLNGEKGSGKTLLAKSIAVKAAMQNMPTIVINAAWHGDKFNEFIQAIDQPAIILFDEFEKVYEPDEQQEILTLLDGVFPTKKLFILTVNDKWRVDQHMRNRPGRIFYMLDFKGLDINFIREYCMDNINNKKYVEQICVLSRVFDQFNFDMLKALIEEMNRYNESPQEAMRMLNTKPEFSGVSRYDVKINVKGKDIAEIYPAVWSGNPLSPSGIDINYDPTPEDKDSASYDVNFTTAELKKIDSDQGMFIFQTENDERLTLIKQKTKEWNYQSLVF